MSKILKIQKQIFNILETSVWSLRRIENNQVFAVLSLVSYPYATWWTDGWTECVCIQQQPSILNLSFREPKGRKWVKMIILWTSFWEVFLFIQQCPFNVQGLQTKKCSNQQRSNTLYRSGKLAICRIVASSANHLGGKKLRRRAGYMTCSTTHLKSWLSSVSFWNKMASESPFDDFWCSSSFMNY